MESDWEAGMYAIPVTATTVPRRPKRYALGDHRCRARREGSPIPQSTRSPRPARRAFHLDQLREAQTANRQTENLNRDRRLLELLVRTPANDFPQQIDCTEARGQCEIETCLKCSLVPAEGEARTGVTQIEPIWGKRHQQSSQIRLRAPVDDIDILSGTSRSVRARRRNLLNIGNFRDAPDQALKGHA